MKAVTSQDDAIEKAYYMGMLSEFGSLKIEGIGNRKTNWGIGTTFMCSGIPSFVASYALSWITNIEANFLNKQQLSMHLTTIEETENFSIKMGILPVFENMFESVREYDKEMCMREKHRQGEGRIDDDTPIKLICPMKDHEIDIELNIIEELEKWASFDILADAFNKGKRGLTLSEKCLGEIKSEKDKCNKEIVGTEIVEKIA